MIFKLEAEAEVESGTWVLKFNLEAESWSWDQSWDGRSVKLKFENGMWCLNFEF